MGFISEIFNFDNIGGKIKNFAKWFCWITILLIWISSLIIFIVWVSDEWTVYLCWIPIVYAIVGPFVVWLGSWAMYAFGEFVEDVHTIRIKYVPLSEETALRKAEKESRQKEKELARKKAQTFACPQCSSDVNYGDASCSSCGQKFDWSEA